MVRKAAGKSYLRARGGPENRICESGAGRERVKTRSMSLTQAKAAAVEALFVSFLAS